ncbi:Hypothetical predicted protein [Xyrichtys novacula]|uniref:Secreted protein n=1 Tax=Xyrichtys novacula TaxID=13765 RepID=A0AAV1GGJ6_XYRNO|nr:Hypothetical predicted protein [Xyrichtys novacula]
MVFVLFPLILDPRSGRVTPSLLSLSLNSFFSQEPEKPQSQIRTNTLTGFRRRPEGVLIRRLYRGEAGGREECDHERWK